MPFWSDCSEGVLLATWSPQDPGTYFFVLFFETFNCRNWSSMLSWSHNSVCVLLTCFYQQHVLSWVQFPGIPSSDAIQAASVDRAPKSKFSFDSFFNVNMGKKGPKTLNI